MIKALNDNWKLIALALASLAYWRLTRNGFTAAAEVFQIGTKPLTDNLGQALARYEQWYNGSHAIEFNPTPTIYAHQIVAGQFVDYELYHRVGYQRIVDVVAPGGVWNSDYNQILGYPITPEVLKDV